MFVWVPGHVDIRGNSDADSAAKDALVGDISLELIPFSDLKALYKQTCIRAEAGMSSRKRNCIKSIPDLRQRIICPRANRKEETVLARLHINHSFLTHSFLLKGEDPPMCIGCDEFLTIKHTLLTCSDSIRTRESHYTAQSLHALFEEVSVKKIFNFMKALFLGGLKFLELF